MTREKPLPVLGPAVTAELLVVLAIFAFAAMNTDTFAAFIERIFS